MLQCPSCHEVIHERCMRTYINKTELPACVNCRLVIDDETNFLDSWEFQIDVFDSDDEDFVEIEHDPPTQVRRSSRIGLECTNEMKKKTSVRRCHAKSHHASVLR